MCKDNLLEILQNNGDLNDVRPTTYMVMKEIPVKTWNCTKERLKRECLDLQYECAQKANHILYTEIPKLLSDIEDSVIIRTLLRLPETTPELRHFHEHAKEMLRKKHKLWEVDMPNIIVKDIYNVLLPQCEQEFEKHMSISFKIPKELFIELRPMLDEFCEKIDCTLGWNDCMLGQDDYYVKFWIGPKLTTTVKRVFEQGANF